MLSEKDLLMMQTHYEDMLREAEKERVLRRALKEMPREHKSPLRGLGWLGQQLVHWGCLLEKHYSPSLEPACSARSSSQASTIAGQEI